MTDTAPVTVAVPLDVPFVRGAVTVDSIMIRKPTPGTLRGLKLRDLVEADADAMMTLLPRITTPALTLPEVQAMDLADFVECANQVAGFLPQRGTATASPSE